MDGVDAALVEIDARGQTQLKAALNTPLPDALKQQLTRLCAPGDNELEQAETAAIALALSYTSAVEQLLQQQGLSPQDIRAIGNHGQTVRHRPESGFSIQLGDHQRLACLTEIPVIADFRQKDLILGGQGAPLAPAFHFAQLASHSPCVLLNLGGIANITFIDQGDITGFDTGPANTLMDLWCQKHQGQSYDKDGQWALSGKVIPELLDAMLNDPYFHRPWPKSTGRELFHLQWLAQFLNGDEAPQDVQASLLALTAHSVASAILALTPACPVYLCGGGTHNQTLINAISEQLPGYSLAATNSIGIEADWMEAMAFAWLAWCYQSDTPSNLPSVTGASKASVLGVKYIP